MEVGCRANYAQTSTFSFARTFPCSLEKKIIITINYLHDVGRKAHQHNYCEKQWGHERYIFFL
jgi:hypothetical protein